MYKKQVFYTKNLTLAIVGTNTYNGPIHPIKNL